MENITLILPDQLFAQNPCILKGRKIYLLEETLYYRQYSFHKKKLIFLRACILSYKEFLESNGYDVELIDCQQEIADIRNFMDHLSNIGVRSIHMNTISDHWISERINTGSVKLNIHVQYYPSPAFINTMEDVDEFFNLKKRYHQTDFYIWQRKHRRILLEQTGKPLRHKWTFDAENRSRLPKNIILPEKPTENKNPILREAKEFVEKYFPDNYGSTDHFFYPVNFREAEEWLENFLLKKFKFFGIYEDAMESNEDILFHSVLSPIINVGLLTPDHVLKKCLEFAVLHQIPINSVEGFVRQILGWREFIRIVYEREGRKQRTTNYWGFKKKIPTSFWSGDTGIIPVDNVIKKVLKTGYNHHIERLMVMGNFMLLCEFDPSEVYKWFMEMYIDAFDWVMVPNVYGMTQFADGGIMTTKPYISGSNYLMKMGNWEKGPWQQIWDGLFWRFMDVHRNFFLSQPRMGMLINTLDKMDSTKRDNHFKHAERFLQSLNS
ncbi:MAG: cryptochrome/photolyase family protein [Chitinophagaceae bacterium]